MRPVLSALVVLTLLAGCEARGPGHQPDPSFDGRNTPQSREPGLHVSGHVDIGVVKTF